MVCRLLVDYLTFSQLRLFLSILFLFRRFNLTEIDKRPDDVKLSCFYTSQKNQHLCASVKYVTYVTTHTMTTLGSLGRVSEE